MATLADAAGVSPRVVQRLMRHSSLELTGRYTRPRAVDIDAAASMLPSLKPTRDRPEALAATGSDATPVLGTTATDFAPCLDTDEHNPLNDTSFALCGERTQNPLLGNQGVGSNPTAGNRLEAHRSVRNPVFRGFPLHPRQCIQPRHHV
jgi:hypothetical protein